VNLRACVFWVECGALALRSRPALFSPFRDIAGSETAAAHRRRKHESGSGSAGHAPTSFWIIARASRCVATSRRSADERPRLSTYHDGPRHAGFIDGTANSADRLAPRVAMIPAGTPGEGWQPRPDRCGWVHDLARVFGRCRQSEQELRDRRTKPDSGRAFRPGKPATAHIGPG